MVKIAWPILHRPQTQDIGTKKKLEARTVKTVRKNSLSGYKNCFLLYENELVMISAERMYSVFCIILSD